MNAAKWVIACVTGLALLHSGQLAAQEEDDRELRLQAFRAEMQASADPVAVAVKMTRDRDLTREGMQVLFKNWRDPRSRRALVEVSNRGVHVARCIITAAGEAADQVRQIDGKFEYESIMKGATTPKEKMAAIRAAFAAHPDWLNPAKRNSEDHYVVEYLVKTARDFGKADAVDLLFLTGLNYHDDGVEFADAWVAYFKREGRANIMGHDDPYGRRTVLFTAVGTKNAAMADLLEDWLTQSKADNEQEKLIRAIARTPDAKKRLLKAVKDDRISVAKPAVGWVSFLFPCQESHEAVNALSQRRRAAGAEQPELSYYAAVLRGIEAEIASQKKTKAP